MIGTLLADRFRLEAELGAGGMSTVYRAYDAHLDRTVAIKVLHREISGEPDQLERFRHEARVVAGLSHPNVVTVIDAGEDETGHPYIVFEHVDGETLKQLIRSRGRLAVPEAVAYAIEVARGLEHAHAAKLVHRDVKPQNVLLDEEGRAKVTDFGIARRLESKGLTATGRVLGTTDYVSPEQALGQEVDGRSDIYSLGVVLYEMLTGEVPFSADSPVGVAMKHVQEVLPDVQRRRPEVSSALAAVLERATAKRAEQRHQSVAELLTDLEAAMEVEAARAASVTGEATAVLDSLPERPRRRRRALRSLAAGLALVAAAAGLAGLLVSVTGEQGEGGNGEARAAGTAIDLSTGAATDFDPPPGDRREHPDEVGLALDGNPVSAWTTETYRFGLQRKPGVGLYIDAGRPLRARRTEIRATTDDWDLEVLAATGPVPPPNLAGWVVVGRLRRVGTQASLDLDTAGQRFRYYLYWITRLAANDKGPGYRVGIGDIKLFG